MAHWAELDENNIVLRVVVGNNDDEDEGYQWLIDNLGGTWMKTSYNAIGGKRRNPETNEITNEPGFRKNFAGIGFTYDPVRDAFIPPKPDDIDTTAYTITYIFNEDKCLWDWHLVAKELPEESSMTTEESAVTTEEITFSNTEEPVVATNSNTIDISASVEESEEPQA